MKPEGAPHSCLHLPKDFSLIGLSPTQGCKSPNNFSLIGLSQPNLKLKSSYLNTVKLLLKSRFRGTLFTKF